MLEQELKSLQFNRKAIIWGGIAGYIVGVVISIMSDGKMKPQAYLILSVVWIAFIGWTYLTNFTKLRFLTNYLASLKVGAMDEALKFGRSYYSVKRNGITGFGKTAIFDEAAINNDISAYANYVFSQEEIASMPPENIAINHPKQDSPQHIETSQSSPYVESLPASKGNSTSYLLITVVAISVIAIGLVFYLKTSQTAAAVEETATEVDVQYTEVDETESNYVDTVTTVEEPALIEEEVISQGFENLPNSITDFVPDSYSILSATKGNLNLDDLDDYVLVLQKTEEESSTGNDEEIVKRPLFLMIGQEDGSFKLLSESENAVYCSTCGGAMGDPFDGITIKDGYFSVEHYGGSAWRWTRILTFKYSPDEDNWFLSRDGSESFHAQSPDKVESHIKTITDFGKIRFDEFDIYKEETEL